MSSQPLAQAETCVGPNGGVIEAHAVSKTFGRIHALDGIDLVVTPGELFGLVGPDGAGKTTFLQILGGVMPHTNGSIMILGTNPRSARRHVGYLTQQTTIYAELSIDDNLRYSAGVRDVPSHLVKERRDRFLREVDLLQFSDRLAGHLSGGMRQKLALCCALISAPRILLLDEPTTGLDPVSRREFWHLLASLIDNGTTTIVATPQFDEAELCQRVAFVSAGKLLQIGAPADLRAALGLIRLEVRSNELSKAEHYLNAMFKNEQVITSAGVMHVFGDRIDVLTKPDPSVRQEIVSMLSTSLAEPAVVLSEQPTLENVFTAHLESEGHKAHIAISFPWSSAADGRNIRQTPSSEQHVAISASKLTKKFQQFEAVKDIDLEIRYGEIYGLLGANGAGKTTTIQMLCGLLQPSAGQLSVCGETKDLNRSSRLRRKIGYMSQTITLYDDLTLMENLNFYASAYSLFGAVRKEKIDWVLEVCGLQRLERSLVGKLPRGFKQRIAFATAVMHEPEILFLDEPTSGVDPLARRQLWQIIRDLARNGTAIIVTTHFLDDAEYCNRLGLMVHGELVAQGPPGLIKKEAGKIVEISTLQVFEAFDALSSKVDPSQVSIFPGRIHVQIDEPSLSKESVRAILNDAGISFTGLQAIPSSLEDAFVTIVRKRRNQVK